MLERQQDLRLAAVVILIGNDSRSVLRDNFGEPGLESAAGERLRLS